MGFKSITEDFAYIDFVKKKNKNINCFSVSKLIFSYDPPFWLMPTVYAYICVLKTCIATQCTGVFKDRKVLL